MEKTQCIVQYGQVKGNARCMAKPIQYCKVKLSKIKKKKEKKNKVKIKIPKLVDILFLKLRISMWKVHC